MGLLDDKVSIITGAGRGIGKETALLFAREGARLVLDDADLAIDGTPSSDARVNREALLSEISALGGEAVFDDGDVREEATASRLTELALDRFGRLDSLVCCAGILRDRTLVRQTWHEWQDVLDVHLGGTFRCVQAAARVMRKTGGGSIVTTTSRAGLVGNFGQSNYAAAQGGVVALTRTAALELQRDGVRVNAVAPLAKTRVTEGLPIFEHVETMQPRHVAPAYLFLASDLGSHVSGQVVSVAGGKLSVYRLVESSGQFKDGDDGVWSAREIAESWSSISRG